jgi:glutaconate CoA-transferase subunit A
MTQRVTVDELAARVPAGASVILTKGEGPDCPVSLIQAMIRGGARDLHVYTLPACATPVSGMMVDQLIGAGCVASLETSGVSLGEAGPAPCFGDAVRSGRVAITDATCPAIYAAVQAGGKAQPFTTLRGLIGTDIERNRDDYTIIDNPFDPNDPVVVIKAINPDVALFHAPCADRHGNVWIGRMRDALYCAHASGTTLVTVEETLDCDFFEDPKMAAGVIPSFYIDAIAHAPGGALPMQPDGQVDMDHIRAYAAAARSPDGFARWMEETLPGREAAQ